ncbi:MAG: hypothetical protein U0736_05245 [Gemmataceae bacterium]
MAKGRTRSRMELREQYEAAEARERDARVTGEEEDEDLGDISEGGDDEAAEGEEKAPVKKAAKKKKPATEAKPRKKAVKVVRKRIVWVVFDNSSKKVAQFDYPKKAEAEALVEKLKAEKKQTYFVQPIKEEITE